MCRHVWREINDLRVCTKCGLTVNMLDGKVMLDREFINATKKKRRNLK